MSTTTDTTTPYDWQDLPIVDLVAEDHPLYAELLAKGIASVGGALEYYEATGEPELGEYLDKLRALYPDIPTPIVKLDPSMVLVNKREHDEHRRREQLLAQIIEQNQHIRQLQAAADDAKRQAQEARKQVDAAVACLQGLIAQANDPQPLLFDPNGSSDEESSPPAAEAACEELTVLERDPRLDTALSEVTGLTQRMLERLYEHDIETLGDLAELEGTQSLQEAVPGIGAATAAKIADACADWYHSHPLPAGVVVRA